MRHAAFAFTAATRHLRGPSARPRRDAAASAFDLIALDSDQGEALLFGAEARKDYTPLIDAVRHAGQSRLLRPRLDRHGPERDRRAARAIRQDRGFRPLRPGERLHPAHRGGEAPGEGPAGRHDPRPTRRHARRPRPEACLFTTPPIRTSTSSASSPSPNSTPRVASSSSTIFAPRSARRRAATSRRSPPTTPTPTAS